MTGRDGVVAATLDQLPEWRPTGEEADTQAYRVGIAAFLDERLGRSRGDGAAHEVTVQRGAATADVVVDGDAVGVLVEPTVTEGGQARLRTRLDRFTGEYDLLAVVGVDVRDADAWTALQRDYDDTGATRFAFVAAPAPDPSAPTPWLRDAADDGDAGTDDGSDGRFNTDPPAGEPPSLGGLLTSGVGVVFWLAVLALVGSALFVFYSWTTPAVPAPWVDRAKTVLFGSFVVAVGIIRFATNSSLRD